MVESLGRGKRRAFLVRMSSIKESNNRKAPDEQHIQTSPQRQRHGGQVRAHRRRSHAFRARARDTANADVAMIGAACTVGVTRISDASGSSWLPLCPEWRSRVRRGRRPGAVGRAREPVHRGFRGEVRVGLMTVASQRTVSGLLRVAWRTARGHRP